MISATSRYANSQVVTVTQDGLPRQVITPSQQMAYSFNYISYQVRGSDRLDLLAWQFYGDPTVWWKIADANPEIISWLTIPAGTVIRVPYT